MRIEIADDAKNIGDFWFFTYSNVLYSLCIITDPNSITISDYIEFHLLSFMDKNIKITRQFCVDLIKGNSLDLPKRVEVEYSSALTGAKDFNTEMCVLVPNQYKKYPINDWYTRVYAIRMVK